MAEMQKAKAEAKRRERGISDAAKDLTRLDLIGVKLHERAVDFATNAISEFSEDAAKNIRSEKYDDPSKIPGFDNVTSYAEREFPGLFPEQTNDAGEVERGAPKNQQKLFEMLKVGRKLRKLDKRTIDNAAEEMYDKSLATPEEKANVEKEVKSAGFDASGVPEHIQETENENLRENAGGTGEARGDAETGEPDTSFEPDELERGGAGEPGAGRDFGKPLTPEEKNLGKIGGGSGLGGPEAAEALPKLTALANEITDKEREANKLPPLMREARLTNPQVWDQAMATLDRDPQAGAKVVDNLAKNPRPATIDENALLLQRRIALSNEYDRAVRETMQAGHEMLKGNRAGRDPAVTGKAFDQAAAKEEGLKQQIDATDRVISATGTEAGRAFQFRRQLAAEDYSLGSMLRQAEAAKQRPLTVEERTALEGMQKQITDLQEKLNKAEDALAASGKGKDSEAFPGWQEARVKALVKQGEFQKQLTSDRWANMPWQRRVMDWLVKARVAEVISSPMTLAKIGLASLERIAISPGEQLVGRALQMLPGIADIAAKAPVEGRGFDVGTELAALKSAGTEGLKDGWKTIRTGESDLDTLYGKPQTTPRTWLDWIGDMHGAEKAPAVRAAYERAFSNIEAHEKAAGRDTTSPAAILRIGQQAYAEGARAKFQQDNAVAKGFQDYMDKLRRPEQSAGTQAIGTLGKVLLPVVRFPTNIVAEAFNYTFGSVTGSTRAAVALAKGVESLRPEQADVIMRSMKKGTLGVAALALGYYLGPKVGGGFYTGKREKSDVEPEGVRTPWGDIPAAAMHNPLLMVFQLGAAVSRAEKQHPQEGLADAVGKGLGGLIMEVPLVREQAEVARTFEGGLNMNAVGGLAKSLAIPQFLQWFARQTDRRGLTGPTIDRKAKGFSQQLESGVPGLRQTLPIK